MRTEDGIVVCGLGFGDEGKGTIVDALARRFAPADIVRYNGGPQAGHNVVDPGGRWHCYAQFGAATFVDDSRTILGPHMLVELENLEMEMRALMQKGVTDARKRLVIDPRCRLITPMHKFVGRIKELVYRRGSCGQGVGETVYENELGIALTLGDLDLEKLKRLSDRKRMDARALLDTTPLEAPYRKAMAATYDQFLTRSDAEVLHLRYRRILQAGGSFLKDASAALAESKKRGRTRIFEGAQGALLDRTRGFWPHVTKSDTTCRHALDLCAPAAPFKLGILRAYGHRHGAGPFVTEDESLRPRFDDALNRENPWQGKFRLGWLDLPALRYGIAMNGGVDGLALTGLDRLSGLETIRICASYRDADGATATRIDPRVVETAPDWISGCRPLDWIELPGWRNDLSGARRPDDLPLNAKAFLRFLESADGLGLPIEIVSVGPRSDQKIFLRE